MEQWRNLLQELHHLLEGELVKMRKLEAERGAENLTVKQAPPEPLLSSFPWSLSSETATKAAMPVSTGDVESSWILEKAALSLPHVAADEDDLDHNTIEEVTRSIRSVASQKAQGSVSDSVAPFHQSVGLSDTRTHFRVVRAAKTAYLQQRPWYVINPDQSRWASRWQALVACCLLWVALVTPVQVALLEPEMDWLFIAGMLVDVVFAIDLLLQFITAYPETTPQGVTWVVQAEKIREHYVKSWFSLDAISILPFDILALTFEASELRELAVLKVIRALRLVKPLALTCLHLADSPRTVFFVLSIFAVSGDCQTSGTSEDSAPVDSRPGCCG